MCIQTSPTPAHWACLLCPNLHCTTPAVHAALCLDPSNPNPCIALIKAYHLLTSTVACSCVPGPLQPQGPLPPPTGAARSGHAAGNGWRLACLVRLRPTLRAMQGCCMPFGSLVPALMLFVLMGCSLIAGRLHPSLSRPSCPAVGRHGHPPVQAALCRKRLGRGGPGGSGALRCSVLRCAVRLYAVLRHGVLYILSFVYCPARCLASYSSM